MYIEPRVPEALYKGIVGVFVALGCVCITTGVTVALYAGWIVYLLIEDPKRVAIVAYLIDLTAKNLQAAHGKFEGQPFEIELGEPIYWLIFLLVGAFLLSIIAGVAKMLVSVGIELLRPAIAELRRTDNSTGSGMHPPKV